MSKGQSYDAWFTEYPSTHEKAGQTVEVVTREWSKNELGRLLESMEMAERSLKAGHAEDAAGYLRSGLSDDRS